MSFKFMVISEAGIPLFEYPLDTSEGIAGMNIDSVLFSGLISAINNYSVEATGEMIDELKFGTVQSAFSKDGFNNLYVILSSDTIPPNILKQMHVEIKALFMNSLDELGISINPDDITKIENVSNNTKQIESIFNPFYRMWCKKLGNINK